MVNEVSLLVNEQGFPNTKWFWTQENHFFVAHRGATSFSWNVISSNRRFAEMQVS